MAKAKTRNYRLIKKKMIKLLEEGDFDFQPTDIFLVDRFIEVHEIADDAMDDIRLRGVVAPVNDAGTVLQKNHSISAYNEALKTILEISKKLGLSARDRADLGITPKVSDNF